MLSTQRLDALPEDKEENDEGITTCWFLQFENGSKSYLKKGTNIVGRTANNTSVVIEEPFVSTAHAVLTCKLEGCFLMDMESLNGTKLNNVRIKSFERIEIKDSDIITFGNVDTTFHITVTDQSRSERLSVIEFVENSDDDSVFSDSDVEVSVSLLPPVDPTLQGTIIVNSQTCHLNSDETSKQEILTDDEDFLQDLLKNRKENRTTNCLDEVNKSHSLHSLHDEQTYNHVRNSSIVSDNKNSILNNDHIKTSHEKLENKSNGCSSHVSGTKLVVAQDFIDQNQFVGVEETDSIFMCDTVPNDFHGYSETQENTDCLRNKNFNNTETVPVDVSFSQSECDGKFKTNDIQTGNGNFNEHHDLAKVVEVVEPEIKAGNTKISSESDRNLIGCKNDIFTDKSISYETNEITNKPKGCSKEDSNSSHVIDISRTAGVGDKKVAIEKIDCSVTNDTANLTELNDKCIMNMTTDMSMTRVLDNNGIIIEEIDKVNESTYRNMELCKNMSSTADMSLTRCIDNNHTSIATSIQTIENKEILSYTDRSSQPNDGNTVEQNNIPIATIVRTTPCDNNNEQMNKSIKNNSSSLTETSVKSVEKSYAKIDKEALVELWVDNINVLNKEDLFAKGGNSIHMSYSSSECNKMDASCSTLQNEMENSLLSDHENDNRDSRETIETQILDPEIETYSTSTYTFPDDCNDIYSVCSDDVQTLILEKKRKNVSSPVEIKNTREQSIASIIEGGNSNEDNINHEHSKNSVKDCEIFPEEFTQHVTLAYENSPHTFSKGGENASSNSNNALIISSKSNQDDVEGERTSEKSKVEQVNSYTSCIPTADILKPLDENNIHGNNVSNSDNINHEYSKNSEKDCEIFPEEFTQHVTLAYENIPHTFSKGDEDASSNSNNALIVSSKRNQYDIEGEKTSERSEVEQVNSYTTSIPTAVIPKPLDENNMHANNVSNSAEIDSTDILKRSSGAHSNLQEISVQTCDNELNSTDPIVTMNFPIANENNFSTLNHGHSEKAFCKATSTNSTSSIDLGNKSNSEDKIRNYHSEYDNKIPSKLSSKKSNMDDSISVCTASCLTMKGEISNIVSDKGIMEGNDTNNFNNDVEIQSKSIDSTNRISCSFRPLRKRKNLSTKGYPKQNNSNDNSENPIGTGNSLNDNVKKVPTIGEESIVNKCNKYTHFKGNTSLDNNEQNHVSQTPPLISKLTINNLEVGGKKLSQHKLSNQHKEDKNRKLSTKCSLSIVEGEVENKDQIVKENCINSKKIIRSKRGIMESLNSNSSNTLEPIAKRTKIDDKPTKSACVSSRDKLDVNLQSNADSRSLINLRNRNDDMLENNNDDNFKFGGNDSKEQALANNKRKQKANFNVAVNDSETNEGKSVLPIKAKIVPENRYTKRQKKSGDLDYNTLEKDSKTSNEKDSKIGNHENKFINDFVKPNDNSKKKKLKCSRELQPDVRSNSADNIPSTPIIARARAVRMKTKENPCEIKLGNDFKKPIEGFPNINLSPDTVVVTSPSCSTPSTRNRSIRLKSNDVGLLSDKVVVMFTGLSKENCDELTVLVKRLGGKITDLTDKCTVLITDQIKRTIKFLCCIGKGLPIVSAQWIYDSVKNKKFVEADEYLLKDMAGERNFSFSLVQSIQKARKERLFMDTSIFVTKSVEPPKVAMKCIIESCGGKLLSRFPSTSADKFFVVSCEKDIATWSSKKVNGKLPIVVTAEAILSGVLQQNIQLEKFLLKNTT